MRESTPGDLITPERILYYIENVMLICDYDEFDKWPEADRKKFMSDLYMMAHIGTVGLSGCRHPDWEDEFRANEAKLIASGEMKPYDKRVAEAPEKIRRKQEA